MTSSAKPEKLLFVIGMHRADSSALSAALAPIAERDEQSRELDRRQIQRDQPLPERTAELDLIKRRLDPVSKIPGPKLSSRKLRKHAQG